MRVEVYGQPRDVGEEFADHLDVSRTAILSIDMHRGHLDTAARALGVPIIHVRSVLRRGGVDDIAGIPSAWRRTFPLYVGAIPNSDAHAIEGSQWTEFVTDVLETDLIVETKRRLSAFYPTDLDLLLRNMDVKTVVLDGGFTDCCILNTAFDAANRTYRVVVLKDLVRGTDENLEAAALAMISLHLGLVTTSSDLLTEWEGR
jgi:nicotinamidase-related amidase